MSEVIRDVQEADRAFFAAMTRGDVAVLGGMMAPDCVYIHSFGTRDSRDSYLEKVRSGFFRYHRVDVTRDSLVRRGDVTVITGTMTGMVTAGGVDRRLSNVRSTVWAWTEAGWQLVLFQPTPWLDR